MTVSQALERLAAYEKQAFAYNHASGVLYYDGATAAPKGSADVRADTLGELSRMSYILTTAPETVEMLQTLVQARDRLDPVTARKVSELWRDYEQTHRIPQEEFVAYQQLVSKADAVWHEAKERSDYALFEPYLQRIFDSCRRLAEYMQPDKDPYDAQLDRFERGLTRDTCDRFFAALRRDLVPLIGQVQAHADRVNDAPLHRDFPVAIQREFTDFVMGVMDIDRDHCIVGETEHPFTINFSRDDVRITTNYHADLVASSLYSVVHEGGHALYELHVGRELSRTCLGGGVSMAIHESQSRFYENIIGRSRAFCGVIYPWLREHFAPRLDDVSPEDFYRMINKAQPSLMWDLGETEGTVALRMPDDEIALGILSEVGPMAVSSANRTGNPVSRTVLDAAAQLGASVTFYLDGGTSRGGLGSTIVDCTRDEPVILREGALSADEVLAVVAAARPTVAEPQPGEGDDSQTLELPTDTTPQTQENAPHE